MKVKVLFIIILFNLTYTNAQIRISDSKPLLETKIIYDEASQCLSISIINKETKKIHINNKPLNGSTIWITLLKPNQSNNIAGDVNNWGLGKDSAFIELSPEKEYNYSYNIRDIISESPTFNRIRCVYHIRYYIVNDGGEYEIKYLQGEEILDK